jgi:hypothetical protein
MMKFSLLWPKCKSYDSRLWLDSTTIPGVRFSIRKVSLGQRIELSSRIRELTLKNEFLRAGELQDNLEANLADLLVQKLYVEWATEGIEGLRINGKQGSVTMLIEYGPEELVAEIACAARSQLELSDAERKN